MKLLKLIMNFFKKKEVVAPHEQTIKFGWVKDNIDSRDIKFTISTPHAIPPSIDLRALCPPVYNQGELGSCTANALGGAFQFEQLKQKKTGFIPSRLFIYYNERVIEHTVNQDAGAMIRDGIKTMVAEGVCPETMWTYNISKLAKRPTGNCYKVAADNQIKEYLRLSPHSLYEVKHCLSDGYPVAFGFTVYQSMMSEEVAKTGNVPMPKAGEQPLGGHAVLAVGYDDSKEALIVRNSWGEAWGLNGYFYLPYGFVTTDGLSNDYWTIRVVE